MHANDVMLQLIELFEEKVRDKSSMVELRDCLKDKELGTERSRNIFETISVKTLKAHRLGWDNVLVQRKFEGACAKTLYNLGRPSAAYDPHAQFWVVPHALSLAEDLGVPLRDVIEIFCVL